MFHTRTHLHPDVATTAALLGDASRGGSWLLSIDIDAAQLRQPPCLRLTPQGHRALQETLGIQPVVR